MMKITCFVLFRYDVKYIFIILNKTLSWKVCLLCPTSCKRVIIFLTLYELSDIYLWRAYYIDFIET